MLGDVSWTSHWTGIGSASGPGPGPRTSHRTKSEASVSRHSGKGPANAPLPRGQAASDMDVCLPVSCGPDACVDEALRKSVGRVGRMSDGSSNRARARSCINGAAASECPSRQRVSLLVAHRRLRLPWSCWAGCLDRLGRCEAARLRGRPMGEQQAVVMVLLKEPKMDHLRRWPRLSIRICFCKGFWRLARSGRG